jgi:hypothetical protein
MNYHLVVKNIIGDISDGVLGGHPRETNLSNLIDWNVE